MLNRWLGWLSSLEPVPDPTESVTPQALAAREASSDEEALLGTHPVPRANNPAQSHYETKGQHLFFFSFNIRYHGC
eukprot:COSAG02_NODE_9602_length_2165_cov_13.302562_4_plen_76_part_00